MMAKGPLSGASLGLTGLSNPNPNLTRKEQRVYDLLRGYGFTHDRIMYGIMWDRENERLAARLIAAGA